VLVLKKGKKEKVILQNDNDRLLHDLKERLEEKWEAEGKKDTVVEVRANP
jgi:hypothetical protein